MQIKHVHSLSPYPIFHELQKHFSPQRSNKKLFSLICIALFLYCNSGRTSIFAQGPNFEWAKNMGGPLFDQGYAITVDPFGNVFTAGIFRGNADFDPGPDSFKLASKKGNDNDIYISKLDATGKFLWAKSMGSTNFDYAYGITHDAEGNVYVTGMFYDTVDFDPGPKISNLISNGKSDIFILKLDSAGNFIWAKNVGGSSNNDIAYDIAVDPVGNVYITGGFIDTADFDPGPKIFNLTPHNKGNNTFILKLDAWGNFIWAKDLGQSIGNYSIFSLGQSITTDLTGNVYITGSFKNTVDFDPGPDSFKLTANNDYDIFILKLDSAGKFTWAKSAGSNIKIGSSLLPDAGFSIAVDTFGNVYTTGTFRDTCDFDPSPNVFNLIASDAKTTDIFIWKLNASGDFAWAKSLGLIMNTNSYDNYGYALNLDAAGNVYATGYFRGTINFKNGSNIFNLYSNGGSDIYTIKLNPSGELIWGQSIGGPGTDIGRASALDPSGNLYITGWFDGRTDFNPGSDTSYLSCTVADAFVVKFGCGDTSSVTLTDSADCNGYTLNDTTYMETGTYIQKRPNFLGCDSTITLNLTIIPKLDMEINITINVNQLGTAEHFASYQWMLNGSIIPNATDSTYIVTENGKYQVIVTNERVCLDTSLIYEVKNIVDIVDLNYWANQIQIYPNPTKDVIYISSPIAINMNLCSIEGKVIKQVSGISQISLDVLAEGIYLLQIYGQDGRLIKTEKILKIH